MILIDKSSYEEIGSKYNCSGSNIRKISQRLGITLPKRKKIHQKINENIGICLNCKHQFKKVSGYSSNFCCSECEKKYKHNQRYQLILNGDPSIMRANYSPKNFKQDILNEQNGMCAICGMKPEWNGKPLVFIIDHIDGHASNNKRDNLRCICPNCDSQLDTYKSKNKNGERSYYRYHKNKL